MGITTFKTRKDHATYNSGQALNIDLLDYKPGILIKRPCKEAYHLDTNIQKSPIATRIAAEMLDFIIIMIMTCFVSLALFSLAIAFASPSAPLSPILFISLFLVMIISQTSYIFCTLKRKGIRTGQTLGKEVFNLRVISKEKAALTNNQIIQRELIYKNTLLNLLFFSLSTVFWTAASIWGVKNKREMFIDRLTHTQVVSEQLGREYFKS